MRLTVPHARRARYAETDEQEAGPKSSLWELGIMLLAVLGECCVAEYCSSFCAPECCWLWIHLARSNTCWQLPRARVQQPQCCAGERAVLASGKALPGRIET